MKEELLPFLTVLERNLTVRKSYTDQGKLAKCSCLFDKEITHKYKTFLKIIDLTNWVCQLTKSVDWKVPWRHNQQCNLLCCFPCIDRLVRLNQWSLNHLILLIDWMSNLCKIKGKKTILMFMLQHLLNLVQPTWIFREEAQFFPLLLSQNPLHHFWPHGILHCLEQFTKYCRVDFCHLKMTVLQL